MSLDPRHGLSFFFFFWVAAEVLGCYQNQPWFESSWMPLYRKSLGPESKTLSLGGSVGAYKCIPKPSLQLQQLV